MSQPPSLDFDPRIQGVLNQLTPSQIQHLLASLASQTLSENDHQMSLDSNSNSSLTSYQGPYDFGSQSATVPEPPAQLLSPMDEGLIPFDSSNTDLLYPQHLGSLDLGHHSAHTHSLHPYAVQPAQQQPLNPQQHQQQSQLGLGLGLGLGLDTTTGHEHRIDKSWKAAADIDKDVNALNSSINSLIETFGLDPRLMDVHADGDGASVGESGIGEGQRQSGGASSSSASSASAQQQQDASVQDFDFDSFLNTLSTGDNSDVDYGDAASTAFLDDVPSPEDVASASVGGSPRLQRDQRQQQRGGDSPESVIMQKQLRGRKRKSDVVSQLEGEYPLDLPLGPQQQQQDHQSIPPAPLSLPGAKAAAAADGVATKSKRRRDQ